MELPGHQGNVYCLAAGANMLFSGGHDKTIRVYSYDQAAAAFAPQATLQVAFTPSTTHERTVVKEECVHETCILLLVFLWWYSSNTRGVPTTHLATVVAGNT